MYLQALDAESDPHSAILKNDLSHRLSLRQIIVMSCRCLEICITVTEVRGEKF